MQLPANVVKGFVKQVQDAAIPKNENGEAFGKVRIVNGELFVVLDGSTTNTPSKTSVAVRNDDRVKVLIADHRMMITDNLTSNPLGVNEMKDILKGSLNDYVITNSNIIDSTFSDGLINGSVIQDSTITGSKIEDSTIEGSKIKDSTIEYSNINFSNFQNGSIKGSLIDVSTFQDGTIDGSKIKDSTISGSKIEGSTIDSSHIKYADFETLTGDQLSATTGAFRNLMAGALNADKADIGNLTVGTIEGETATIGTIIGDQAAFDNLSAMYGKFEKLDTTYANIDFANVNTLDVDQAWIQDLMVQGKIIAQQGTIYYLDAVEVNASKITAGEMKADRLLLKGQDGLYYKMNISNFGETEAEKLPQEIQDQFVDHIHGDLIIAKSIQAEKITVSDLSAFGATIGGFTIDDTSIHTTGKDSPDSEHAGSYMGSNGTIHFGSPNQYFLFDPTFVNDDGTVGRMVLRTSEIYLAGGLNMSDMSDNIKKYNLYMRFNDKNMELGYYNNPSKTLLSPEGMAFTNANQLVTYIYGDDMYTANSTVMNNLRFNNFLWMRRPNGNMSLKHVAGDAIPDEVYEAFGFPIPVKKHLYPSIGLYPRQGLYPPSMKE